MHFKRRDKQCSSHSDTSGCTHRDPGRRIFPRSGHPRALEASTEGASQGRNSVYLKGIVGKSGASPAHQGSTPCHTTLLFLGHTPDEV